MTLKIELEIQKGLKENKSPLHIAKELFHKISHEKNSRLQKEKLINFCFTSGLYQFAFDTFQTWLKKKEELPFAQLIELLNLKTKKPKKALIQSLLEGAKKENLEFELTRSKAWDEFEPKIKEIRTQAFKKYKTLLQNKKNLLKEKLIFFKNHNMIQEEKKILKDLYTLNPEDPEMLEYAKDFSERWSLNLLSQFSEQKKSPFLFSEKKLKSKKNFPFPIIKSHIFEKVKKHPQFTYDLSLLFYFMEKYAEAYKILDCAPSSYEIDFYSIELLLQSSRYLEALEVIEKITVQYNLDENRPFLLTYLKAQALKGLGHTTQAIELLKKIVELRPDFRSASQLIEEWNLI